MPFPGVPGNTGASNGNNKGFWDASAAGNGLPDYVATLINTGQYLVVSVAGIKTIPGVTNTQFSVGDYLVKTDASYSHVDQGADIDLSNFTNGTIPKIVNGELWPSAVLEDDTEVRSSKSLGTISESLVFSEALSMGSAGEAFSVTDVAENRRGYLVAYERRDDGSGEPFFRKLEAKSTEVIQSGTTDQAGATTFSALLNTTANRLLLGVYLIAVSNASGVTLELKHNNKLLDTKSGIDLVADTETFIAVDQGLIVRSGIPLELVVTGAELKGLTTNGSFVPYLKVDQQLFNVQELLHQETVVAALEARVGAARLSYNNLKDTPVIPTARTDAEIQAVIGTTLVGSDNITVTANADGTITLSLGDSGGGVTPPQADQTSYMQPTLGAEVATVNLATALTSTALNPSFTIPTYTGNRYLQILQSMAHTEFAVINIGGLNQKAGFTVTDNARLIGGQQYRQYVTETLVTEALTGQLISCEGAS